MTRLNLQSGSLAFLMLFFALKTASAYSGPPIEHFALIVIPEKSSIEVTIRGDAVVETAEVVELIEGKPVGASKLSIDVDGRRGSNLSGRLHSRDDKFREIKIILSMTSDSFESSLKEEFYFWLNCNASPCKVIDWTEYALRTGRAQLRKLSDGSRIVEEITSREGVKK